jgi:hypothetical protein
VGGGGEGAGGAGLTASICMSKAGLRPYLPHWRSRRPVRFKKGGGNHGKKSVLIELVSAAGHAVHGHNGMGLQHIFPESCAGRLPRRIHPCPPQLHLVAEVGLRKGGPDLPLPIFTPPPPLGFTNSIADFRPPILLGVMRKALMQVAKLIWSWKCICA